ncbi:MAG TPA: HAD family phosphatase [Mycetocola sp.]|uniref:HAD family hydrolase n=1 Tax=Mycetocola sp. TaxID=1871042 RepID=UPI00262E87ED|nr:HAD family phosphatase [Mycetocola sp.]HEV7848309.1 HAD family phosphatase [Mycetocola sp.]
MTTQLPAAVLWDMDGTLVDTEPYWIAAETDLVESFGHTWTYEDAMTLVGSGLWESARILQAHGVEMPEDDIVQHLTGRVRDRLTTDGVPFRPGARELLKELRDLGVKTALVTMSVRAMAEQVLSHLDFAAFDVLVPGDEVEHPKPHPEPYLRAASLLGVAISDCVAIEDSRAGLASAVASGAVSIAVPHAVTIPEASTHTTWPTLAGRTSTDVTALFAASRSEGIPR